MEHHMSATVLESAVVAPRWTSSKAQWAGRILSGLAILFLTFDTVFKLIGTQSAIEGTVQLGYRPEDLLIIGLIEIGCLVLLLIPRTAVLGAILWTGYFGGAIATHMIAENPLFSHTIFPIYVAALIWGGLYLRDARVRALIGQHA
jgi:hypothetical protein